jgi:uncharacterized OB-fold protein
MSATETQGVETWRCVCGARYFPERLLCLRCRSHEFTTDRAHEAVVEEVSVIRHMLGQADWKPRRIASVRTPKGLLMTVGITDESGPGDVIELYQDGTAPFGRAKA